MNLNDNVAFNVACHFANETKNVPIEKENCSFYRYDKKNFNRRGRNINNATS